MFSKNRYTIVIIIILVIGYITAILIINNKYEKRKTDLIEKNEKLLNDVATLKQYIDTLENKLAYYDDSIKVLKDSKEKIKIKYETITKDFADYNIVSDDSIIKFIAAKIRDKRRYVHFIY